LEAGLRGAFPVFVKEKEGWERMPADEHGVTEHGERYLEAAYRLSDRDSFVAISELSKFLSVAPASVSEMVKKLSEQGYLEHKRYQGVKLTSIGRRIGGEAVRRHRLAERLLTDLLGASPEQAHEEAHRLEGFLRGDIEKRVMTVLGYPQTCPHGNPLDVGTVENAIPLSEVLAEGPLTIAKIRYDTPEFLNYLKSLELVPPSVVTILERSTLGGTVTLQVRGESGENKRIVGEKVLENIWVFPPDSDQS
jgi:DtxR family Mn-dependent transcriptional regulator